MGSPNAESLFTVAAIDWGSRKAQGMGTSKIRAFWAEGRATAKVLKQKQAYWVGTHQPVGVGCSGREGVGWQERRRQR